MADKFPKARLIELFSAIQGEGLNVGTRQIFIRFAICDLRCQYCDSAHTWQTLPSCKIEQTAGKRNFVNNPNPVELPSLLEWVEKLNQPGLHDSISLTGGEPLLHANFLVEFLPQVHNITGLPVYLETGGHRPEELAIVLPYLDSVGMDIKLPSVSGENHWSAHQQFLKLCHDAKVEVFVKLIISSQTNSQELELAGELVAACDPKIPLFLQPVTPIANQPTILAPAPDLVLEWQSLMKKFVKQVRVVPQTHKMIGQL